MSKVKPLRLFFIRHGQTENYENPPFNGWRDAPLTDYGRHQLDEVAAALRPVNFDAVYSSDLSRALYGGENLARDRGLELVSEPKWREINFGHWEGLNYQQIKAQDSELLHKIFAHDGQGGELPFPGGESSFSFGQRIKQALAGLLANHPEGGRIALVAHGGVCKALWGLLLQMPPHVAWMAIRQDFAAVNVADIYHTGTCVALLINGYLGPEGYRQPGPGLDRLAGNDIF